MAREEIHTEAELAAFDEGYYAASVEVNQLRSWILKAQPLLSKAGCIVADEAIHRMGEIQGIRAVIESCPVTTK